MCDYSLAHFPNRLAVEGEHLVVLRFASGTLGLAPAPLQPDSSFPPPARQRSACRPALGCSCRTSRSVCSRQLGVGAVEEVIFVEQGADAFQY